MEDPKEENAPLKVTSTSKKKRCRTKFDEHSSKNQQAHRGGVLQSAAGETEKDLQPTNTPAVHPNASNQPQGTRDSRRLQPHDVYKDH